MPTQSGDKPNKEVVITDCGELTGDEAESADTKVPDSTGDTYEGTSSPKPSFFQLFQNLANISP